MDRLIDQVSERDGRLLLYAAGELPAEEARTVERELASDPLAREALAELKGLSANTSSALAALDAAEPLAPRVVRRASDRAVRAVFSWSQAEAEARTLRKDQGHALAEGVVWRYARWPLAAAAVLVVGLMLWTFGSEPVPPVAENTTPIEEFDPEPDSQSPVVTGEDPAPIPAPLEQVAALFQSLGSDTALAGGLNEELIALQLLNEPDWE